MLKVETCLEAVLWFVDSASLLGSCALMDVTDSAELRQASEDHFGADPETVLWGEAAWLSDATAKLKDIADQHFRRGEYEA